MYDQAGFETHGERNFTSPLVFRSKS